MRLNYRQIATTASGLEYLELKSAAGSLLCVQAPVAQAGRVRRAFESAQAMASSDRDSAFVPVSCGTSGGMASAVFEGECGGTLRLFLSHATPALQYAVGRRLGRSLRALHSLGLSKEQERRADAWQGRFMERIAQYVASLPHFKGDQAAMEAISSRYDNFGCFRRVLRYGQLRDDRVLVRRDSSVALLPSPSFGPGDACEDFAMMEFSFAGLYPCCCAGVIDGYFQGAEPPARFWVNFALHSAVCSLWRCGREALRGRRSQLLMQAECLRISSDFSLFKKPYPLWYSSPEVRRARDAALSKAL
ncbi:MAG: phosphotransferase [Succinivibrio sp.]